MDDKNSTYDIIKKDKVDKYYEFIKEKYNLIPTNIDYSNFEFDQKYNILSLKVRYEDIQLTSQKGYDRFISLNTLAIKIGKGGRNAIRNLLNISNF